MNDETSVLRRLPVYILMDCSGSMAGEPIVAMEAGIRSLLVELQEDPQALETVWLSVITFGSTADQAVLLSDIHEFKVPDLVAGGSTALGEAVELLAERITEEVRVTTQDQKGDWKPLVFVFTDGEPTDDWEEPVREFRADGRANIIACGAGPEVNEDQLREIGDTVVRLADTQPGTLSAFMEWVSLAVTMTSKSLGAKSDDTPELPRLPETEGVAILP